jgi:hypothetical protein
MFCLLSAIEQRPAAPWWLACLQLCVLEIDIWMGRMLNRGTSVKYLVLWFLFFLLERWSFREREYFCKGGHDPTYT